MICQLIDHAKSAIMWPLGVANSLVHRTLDCLMSWEHLVSANNAGKRREKLTVCRVDAKQPGRLGLARPQGRPTEP